MSAGTYFLIAYYFALIWCGVCLVRVASTRNRMLDGIGAAIDNYELLNARHLLNEISKVPFITALFLEITFRGGLSIYHEDLRKLAVSK